jgi:hypothetical protein
MSSAAKVICPFRSPPLKGGRTETHALSSNGYGASSRFRDSIDAFHDNAILRLDGEEVGSVAHGRYAWVGAVVEVVGNVTCMKRLMNDFHFYGFGI